MFEKESTIYQYLCLENAEQKNQQKGIGMPKLPIILLDWKEPLLLMLSSCFGISYRHDFLQGVGLEDETLIIENVDEKKSKFLLFAFE